MKRIILAVLVALLAAPALVAAQTDLTVDQFFLPGSNTSGYRVHASAAHMTVSLPHGRITADGGYKTVFQFAHVATASLTNQAIAVAGYGVLYQPSTATGSVIGVGIAASEPITAGRATARAVVRNRLNDIMPTRLTVAIGDGERSRRFNAATQARGLDYFDYTMAIGCDLTTTSAITPTNAQLLCSVVVEF